jgi:hypothetical protein
MDVERLRRPVERVAAKIVELFDGSTRAPQQPGAGRIFPDACSFPDSENVPAAPGLQPLSRQARD